MTREEATNILKAKLECYKCQTSETDFVCDDCDECSICYEQGNMGEQKKALEMAIKALEQQSEIIHCKECKFYTEMRLDLDTGICRLSCHHLGGDGFCSEAELKSCKV